jgi:hypothetical protein
MTELQPREVLPPHPDINSVEPFSEADLACFEELRSVLERHNAQSRFGVTLLHQHFTTADDEILVESVDVNERTLTIQPVKMTQLVGTDTIETSWRLDSKEVMQRCESQCTRPYGPSGPHIRQHFTTG